MVGGGNNSRDQRVREVVAMAMTSSEDVIMNCVCYTRMPKSENTTKHSRNSVNNVNYYMFQSAALNQLSANSKCS